MEAMMSHPLQKVVDAVSRLPKHPDDQAWNAGPADRLSISDVREAARKRLNVELVEEYLSLASIYDRMSLDGRWILSVKPQRDPLVDDAADEPEIVNKTLAMRRTKLFLPAENWVWYGCGELDYLVHNLYSNRFELRACEAWDCITFSSTKFSETVFEMFKARLPNWVK